MDPQLIIQVPRGSAVARGLREAPPAAIAGRADVLVETGPTDEQGVLEALLGGEVVLSVPGPEGLARQAGEVERVLAGAGTGTEPLVIVVDAAEELRDDELAPVVAGAARARRPVFLRVIRPG